MKIISILRHLSTVPYSSEDDVERQAEWMRDPLSHPDIDAMTERELADLPFAASGPPSHAARPKGAPLEELPGKE